MTSLQSLDLSCNHIGDEGVKALENAIKQPSSRSLERIDLNGSYGGHELRNWVEERTRKRKLLREEYRRVKAYVMAFHVCTT
eukprot:Nitzschia sp. Nitz4//scaffold431_size8127//278//688//NITZ4_009138-RA/size8127-exonerate_est2genome-gene-0.15-mRNA-1//1//CDS//3329551798//3728//frame0